MPESASERFARAVDGGPMGPDVDDTLREELAVVAALRAAGEAAGPDDMARARMRRELLAKLPKAVQPPPAERPAARRPRTAGFRGRLLVAAAAALCLLLSLSGMSLLMARDALPGEVLYGVKRSAESAELGLTFGDESRGFKHLQFATARLDEVEALVAKDPGADANRYLIAFQDFDSDAAAGSRLLLRAATSTDTSPFGALRDWAQQQSQRIGTITAELPEQASARAAQTRVLLARIAERAVALWARTVCQLVTSGATDDIGLLPADGVCEPAPGRQGTGPGGGPGTSPGGGVPGSPPETTSTVRPTGSTGLPGVPRLPGGPTSGTPGAAIGLPLLPEPDAGGLAAVQVPLPPIGLVVSLAAHSPGVPDRQLG
jgi:hypothetical protein